MLDSFIEDIGINGDQFVEACKQQGNDRPEAVMVCTVHKNTIVTL